MQPRAMPEEGHIAAARLGEIPADRASSAAAKYAAATASTGPAWLARPAKPAKRPRRVTFTFCYFAFLKNQAITMDCYGAILGYSAGVGQAPGCQVREL